MTYPGWDTFPGLLTFPGVWGLSWPPPGWVSVSTAVAPHVGVSVAAAGTVPPVLPWRPKVAVDVPVAFRAVTSLSASMRVMVNIPIPFDVDYLADAIGGSVHINAPVTMRVAPILAQAAVLAPTAQVRMAASVAAVMASWSLTDTFNRADGSIGTSWTSATLAPVINTNKAQAGTGGSTNATNVHYAVHNTPLGTTDHEVEFTVANPVGTADLDRGTAGIVRATEASTTQATRSYVCGGVTSTAAYINTYVNGTAAQRQTKTGISVPAGAVVRFRAQGNKYTLYVNGTEQVSWTGTGNAFAVTSANQRFGFEVSNVRSLSSTSYGYAVDSLTARTI